MATQQLGVDLKEFVMELAARTTKPSIVTPPRRCLRAVESLDSPDH